MRRLERMKNRLDTALGNTAFGLSVAFLETVSFIGITADKIKSKLKRK